MKSMTLKKTSVMKVDLDAFIMLASYYPFKKHVESDFFFFAVGCPSVMSLKPLFEWSQLQFSCKFTTVGI